MDDVIKIKAALKDLISIPSDKTSKFFKTGAGHYAAQDIFIGVTVPNIRKVAKDFGHITLEDIQKLISSPINEERLLALIILVNQYKKASSRVKETIYQFYLSNVAQVNNWNLVDSSAHLIIGAHLDDKDRSSLLTLAKSEIMWERRIAIVATWAFIRKNDLKWTFTISSLLLQDTHDLIHKAVGWMLREAGKRNLAALVLFLDQNAKTMPRTMLRYAIEKFPEDQRQNYLLKSKTSRTL
jgi:3-methyladenine DNA glycosylase AlkD